MKILAHFLSTPPLVWTYGAKLLGTVTGSLCYTFPQDFFSCLKRQCLEIFVVDFFFYESNRSTYCTVYAPHWQSKTVLQIVSFSWICLRYNFFLFFSRKSVQKLNCLQNHVCLLIRGLDSFDSWDKKNTLPLEGPRKKQGGTVKQS